jgi:hypothetical protein
VASSGRVWLASEWARQMVGLGVGVDGWPRSGPVVKGIFGKELSRNFRSNYVQEFHT